MKDKAKTEKETTKQKKAKRPLDPIKALQEKLEYFEDRWSRVGEIEDRMREFTDCCSEILTRLTDQGLVISEFRKNSTMLLEVTDFNRKELDHLRKSTLEFVKHVGNIEDNFKGELEKQNEDLIEWVSLTTDKIREDLQQDMDDNKCRIETAVKMSGEDMTIEIYKSQSSQYSLINQRIDRLYQELQLLSDARGLDLDMKKIVDGLEETVHGLESKLGLRCDLHERTVLRFKERTEGEIYNHVFVFRNEIEDIKKTRKLTEWLLVWSFTMALVAFICTITNLIKQAFF